MELKYIVMTIIKILISVPCILMVRNANAASLMGGHFNNNGNSTLPTPEDNSNNSNANVYQRDYDEEIPDPSALILPGYNLPDNIFNKGKPFYLEKDPLTGQVDFESKSAMSNMEEYDYVEEEPSPDIYDKANIDRKDGSLSGHKPSDVNQLTPNFHDFLNLPVKYNPEKYVYPLISSSYANTKVQGNINKYHNHKNYIVTTYKPTYFTVKTPYFNPNNAPVGTSTTTTTTTTTAPAVTTETTKGEIYLTTKNINNIYFTTPSSTKRPLSLFEQLFGEYDEMSTESTSKPTRQDMTTKKTVDFDNVLTGTEMGHESAYEYEDDYGSVDYHNNTVVFQAKPVTTSTTVKTTTTTEATTKKMQNTIDSTNNEYDYDEEPLNTTTAAATTTVTTSISATTPKIIQVTSMQLGERHYSTADTRPPIIAVTQQNIREQLNNERVQKPINYQQISNTNSIRILPNQDTVSFVVGNHQHVGGSYETQFKESPYDSNPFRPLIVQAENDKDTVSYVVQAKPEFVKPIFSQPFSEVQKLQPHVSEIGGSSINIQPIKTSEASLSIGVPVSSIKKIPGQVVDENLSNEKIEFPKTGTGAKIVFPDDKDDSMSTIIPNLQPPPPSQTFNQDILHLNSKPMYHQLPSDLTPPNEPLPHMDRPRPPWDPRPGHFHNGKPEYLRPPRPQLKQQGDIYKRIDKLPNILPQFRPNAKISSGPHYFDSMKNGYLRQPLLERPSNRPVSFYEKLLPPAPPKNLHNLRKVPILEDELRTRNSEKRLEHFEFYQHQTPPPVVINNRRIGNEPGIETLQMLQAKHFEKPTTTTFKSIKIKDGTDKPLYVVYPVNTAPIKLDALDSNKKETVVIGTRAELPLPPSKINQEFAYESPQDRNDSPILKPHTKVNFPLKSSFPYPMERPDLSSTTITGNYLDTKEDWARVVNSQITNSKLNYKNPNQISVTLKTFTEKPIAIAYTPTEPYRDNGEKYSMPNYASPVISEIRPSFTDKRDSEITLSAVMHTGNQPSLTANYQVASYPSAVKNHKPDTEDIPAKLEFQAPFQASVNMDGMTQGWTVVRKTDKSKIDRADQGDETTTSAIATTSHFDIENFKPELFGGFKPIYNYSDSVQSNDTRPGGDGERDRKL